jgi:AcrR family transcriptional regulator
MARDRRRQMLDTAIELFRLHGYNGTGFRQVVAESGAPRGSMYHHFPGGKVQLGTEAVALAGQLIHDYILKKILDEADDFVTGLEAIWSWWIDHVEKAEFAGCPVLAVAVESHPEAPELTAAAAAVFDSWVAAYRSRLERSGLDHEEAQDYALLIMSALEGATGLSRADRNRETLERVGRRIATIIRARLSDLQPA